ncbi:MAG: hypothetical protein H7Y30_07105 [Pyrinomonadaceae bacterium]|nr:hypothetical protein [Pyrinomonadaceae bacterium]
MKLNRKISVLVATIIGLVLITNPAAALDQPRMQAAREDLVKAQTSLNRATSDKGGHRNRALEIVAQAIKEVDRGIEYDRTHITPRKRPNSDFAEDNVFALTRTPDQPNMQQARTHLQNALSNLNRASADKGTHRTTAMQLIRDAIAQVDAGIEYDRTH